MRGAPAMARVDELVDGIYRICTTVQLPDTEFQFNQFLIDDERPALIHTGMYGLYEGVRDGIAEVLDPSKLEPKRLREAKHRLEEELSFEQRANDLYEAWRERETRKRGRGQMAPGAVTPHVPPEMPAGKI